MRFPPIIQGRQPQGAVRIDLPSQIAAAFRGGFVASFHQRGRMAHGGAFTSDTTARTASQGGLGLEIKSATAPDTRLVGTGASWLSGATQATFFCVFAPRSVPNGTTEERLFSRWGTGGNDQFLVQMYGPNIGVAVRSAGASGTEARRSSGISLEAGKLYVAVCTWNNARSGSDRHRFWLNGAALSSVDWAVAGTVAALNPSTAPDLQFGQDNGATPRRASDTVILAAGVTPVDIGNGAAAEISANPWQLFEPERRIWVPVSAVAGSFEFSASGGIQLSGTAPAESSANYAISGAGGLSIGGEATLLHSSSYAASGTGGVLWSGAASASVDTGYEVTGAGGIEFGGAAAVLASASYLATGAGGLLLGGAADAIASANYAAMGAGGLLFGGEALASWALPSTGDPALEARVAALEALAASQAQLIAELRSSRQVVGSTARSRRAEAIDRANAQILALVGGVVREHIEELVMEGQ